MDSESEELQVCGNNASFFDGFGGNKLQQYSKRLRKQVATDSYQENKQTTLHEKVAERNKEHKPILKEDRKCKVSERVVVEEKQVKKEQSSKAQKAQKSFESMKLIRPLLKAINQVEYFQPTPIQSLAIPTILRGRDVVASSITGSGKTAAFLIPILQRYFNAVAVGYIRALIVTPTRELAIQIYEQLQKLNKYTRLQGMLAIGGSCLQKQENSLRQSPEIVIGTPGRIIDLLLNSRSVGMENLQMLILDQADKLLQLGFQSEINQIMKHVNEEVQTVLFSATMGPSVKRLTKATTSKPVRVSADPDNKTAEKLHQQMIKLREETDEYRQSVLLSVLLNLYNEKVIVFFKTKKQCHRIAIILGLMGMKACELHGNLSQTQRIDAFHQFKEGKFDILLATDLASRGIDIKEVKSVINFELPVQLTRYIHRVGRTARAGNVGTSLTLCSSEECLQLKKMSKKTGDKLFKLSVDEKMITENINKINELQRDISQILAQEREERDMRRADIELKKVENLTDHREEIYSRPKREWFMTETQKKAIQQEAKKEAGIFPQQKYPKKQKKIFKKKFKQRK